MTLTFANLDLQRRAGGVVIVAFIWATVAAVMGARLANGGPLIGLLAAAVSVAGLATVAARWGGGSPTGRALTGVALMAQVSLLVAAMWGSPWQIDMHMAYFAALALLVIYCDWFVIAAAAATVAVHHLVLSYVIPAAVFPGSADLGRVVIHAGILVVEAATLMWVTTSVNRMIALSADALATAEQAVKDAESANTAAAQARNSEQAGGVARAKAQAHDEAERVAVVSVLASCLERLARGDLSFTLRDRFAETYEQLRADLNMAVSRLGGALGRIEGDVASVRRGSDQIAEAIHNLSRRTEQQAASLEETAAAMDGITTTVGDTAKGALQAANVVILARDAARESSEIVAEAIAAMGGIQSSSSQIGQIIGVIDEIAFQTNLLALNAGVEAARAGDAGRGFAVVAQEVRALAQRSAEAAREIKTLINESSRQVGAGVELVGQSGEALGRIVLQITEVDSLVSGIAASAQSQAAGLKEINVAVNQMDQVLQQNAAMVEETSAATQTLSQDAEHLRQLVAEFELPNEGQAGAALRRTG
jgi:methyl-accepting chemotaxis protein